MVIVDTTCAKLAADVFEETADDITPSSGSGLRDLARRLAGVPDEIDTEASESVLDDARNCLIEAETIIGFVCRSPENITKSFGTDESGRQISGEWVKARLAATGIEASMKARHGIGGLAMLGALMAETAENLVRQSS